MKSLVSCAVALVCVTAAGANAQSGAAASDSFPHTVRFIAVDTNVKLEVVDWRGSGRPVVFLAGLTDDAHVLDGFVSRLAAKYRCVAITRRGFGASSAPPIANGNYASDRLGDDVLAVIDSLGLKRPVLVGHSFAGAELSSIGSRYPDRVAGLVYLDAVAPYSFYDRSVGNMRLDALELKRQLDDLLSGVTWLQRQASEELRGEMAHFEGVLERFRKQLATLPPSPPRPLPARTVSDAVALGWQKYTHIPVPILALVPETPGPGYVALFEAGVPTARVVRIPGATHYIYTSNRAEVLREMDAFIAKLPPR